VIDPKKPPVADIYFEEGPAAGDGHYLDHFLGSCQTWVRTLTRPKPETIAASEIKTGEERWMQVPIPEATERSVDVYGKFGVYAYGATKVLLHYYARNLQVASHDGIHELGRAEQMRLDLVPHDDFGEIELTLLWRGEPVADRMVFIRGPQGFRQNVKTDEHGMVSLLPAEAGRYTFRSSYEQPTPGDEDGEKYELIRHNITLVMQLPLEY
jgi:hypothetical protein